MKYAAVFLLAVLLPQAGALAQPKNLGMVGVTSVHGRFLQAVDEEGELHAGSSRRDGESTWFLVEVDRAKRLYALQNWQTGKFLGKAGDGCAVAVAARAGAAETWQLVPGADFGVLNALALRSAVDGTFLGADSPGNAGPCGGEVAASSGARPPSGNSLWAGWWTFQPAAAPAAGKRPWNAKGRPADVNALLAALL